MPFTWNGDFSRESVLILAQVTAFAICKALTKMLNKIKTTNKTTKTKNKPTLQKNIVIKASATSYHCFLLQHAVQGKLTGADTALARWWASFSSFFVLCLCFNFSSCVFWCSLRFRLVFCHTHCDLPLDYRSFSYPEFSSFAASKSMNYQLTPQQFRVFLPILEKLSYALDNSLLHAEEEAKFSEVALVFVNHCVEFIRKHRCSFPCPNTILLGL